VAKSHAGLAALQPVISQRLPTERDILELAELTSYVFDSPEAVGLKARLKKQAEVYRDWLESEQLMKDEVYHASLGVDEQGRRRVAYGIGTQRSIPGPESVTFLLAFLFTCPQILSRPTGFEWVLRDFEKVLFARRLDPPSDQKFEKAMNKARTRSRVGPPKDKALEYFRYATITELMNPSLVIPGVKAKKLNKTKAVEFVATMETRLVNGTGETRSIWRAHKRVKRFMQQLTDREQAKTLPVPPPIKSRARELQESGRKSKKRMTPSTHRKRVRRT
jgi:hypothetical protein